MAEFETNTNLKVLVVSSSFPVWHPFLSFPRLFLVVAKKVQQDLNAMLFANTIREESFA